MRNFALIISSLALVIAANVATATPLISLGDWALDISDRDAVSQYGLSSDFGGSYKVTVSGAPDNLDLAAPLLTSISTGDIVTLTLAHSALPAGYNAFYFGDNAGSLALPGPVEILYNSTGVSGSEPIYIPYEVTWVSTGNYAAGTDLRWVSTVWPGTHDFYFISATVVPEPSTALLLSLGLIGFAAKKSRHKIDRST